MAGRFQTREDGIRRSVRAQQDERAVYTEAGLLGALTDIATRGAKVRSILIAEAISLNNPVVLSSAHDGLIIRGLGLRTGLFGQGIVFDSAGGPAGLVLENLTLQSFTAASGGSSAAGSIRCSRVEFLGNVSLTSVNDITFDDCVTYSTATVTVSGGTNSAITRSKWQATTALSGLSGFVIADNRSFGACSMSSACTAVVIDGNTLSGNLNTSSGGGGSVIVGNHKNGFTVTSHASDVNASNHT